MRHIVHPAALLVAALCVTGRAAEEPGVGVEHDFGDSVVVFTLEYEDDLLPPAPWALTGAKVRRLGNSFFLTGTEPPAVAADEVENAAPRRHWIPVVDIVRLTEFDDVAAARRALEMVDDEGRPPARSVSRRSARSGRDVQGR